MYSSISIEGFRCFPRFELHGLPPAQAFIDWFRKLFRI
jgi:hypothetical protein